MGTSATQMACTRKTALQKKTLSYKKKVRKGKALPCPCDYK